MRVLCITSHRGSIPNVRPEAEAFIGLEKRGVDLTVMTQDDSVYAGPMRAAGIQLIDFEPRRKIDPRAIRTIRRELASGYDVLHLFNNKAICNGIFAAIGLPVKVVTYRGQTGNIRRHNPGAWLTHLSPRVDRIVCVAEAVRTDLIANGVPAAKAVTIYKGHDLAWYTAPPADLAEFGIPADACVVGLVANARPRKGVDVLLRAAALLAPELQVHVLLVGGGMEQYRRQIAELPLTARVHVAGYREDADQLIAACQIAVLPALRREGLPKSIIEAMAYGITPIVSRTGGNAELVEDEVSGLVVPPGDHQALARAIEMLCRDPARRHAMGLAARGRIDERFNVRSTIDQTLATYQSLLESR